MTEEKVVDWASIELHYRAGKMSLQSIGDQFGISKGRISQVAKRDEWSRDLAGKINAKAASKVARELASRAAKQDALNDPGKQASKRLGEAQVVDANATIIMRSTLLQQEHLRLSQEVSLGMLQELALLSRADLAPTLELMGEQMDKSGPTDSGGWKADKVNETYKYIISLAGRLKMAKDAAATLGVTLPLERKVLRMDDEQEKGASAVDTLLSQVLASQ